LVAGKYLNTIKHKIVDRLGGVVLKKYDYRQIMDRYFTSDDKLDHVFPTILPQWDRSPRSGRRAVIYHNSTPEYFGQHVGQALNLLKDKRDENKILFLKSWNEWGEGNYIEPDLRYGRAYLDALKGKIY
jgi:hypothetical protein